jgi:hypothetical protein
MSKFGHQYFLIATTYFKLLMEENSAEDLNVRQFCLLIVINIISNYLMNNFGSMFSLKVR